MAAGKRGQEGSGAVRLALLIICGLLLQITACRPALPEPDSAGARLYRARCGSCHRLFAPSSMTQATWELNLRMHIEGSRRGGKVPLTREEQELLLDYLARHSGHVS